MYPCRKHTKEEKLIHWPWRKTRTRQNGFGSYREGGQRKVQSRLSVSGPPMRLMKRSNCPVGQMSAMLVASRTASSPSSHTHLIGVSRKKTSHESHQRTTGLLGGVIGPVLPNNRAGSSHGRLCWLFGRRGRGPHLLQRRNRR